MKNVQPVFRTIFEPIYASFSFSFYYLCKLLSEDSSNNQKHKTITTARYQMRVERSDIRRRNKNRTENISNKRSL